MIYFQRKILFIKYILNGKPLFRFFDYKIPDIILKRIFLNPSFHIQTCWSNEYADVLASNLYTNSVTNTCGFH